MMIMIIMPAVILYHCHINSTSAAAAAAAADVDVPSDNDSRYNTYDEDTKINAVGMVMGDGGGECMVGFMAMVIGVWCLAVARVAGGRLAVALGGGRRQWFPPKFRCAYVFPPKDTAARLEQDLGDSRQTFLNPDKMETLP